MKPSGGSIEFEGENITGLDPTSIVTKGITLVPEGRKIFPDLTVLENLKIGAYLRKDDLTDDLNWVYDLFPRLKERSWQAAGTLSGGEQQRAALAKVLLTRPQLLLLDEPTKGIDSFFKETFASILTELKKKGITIVMVSHDVEFCAKYADQVSMFFDGQVLTTDTPRRFFGANSFYTTAANRMSRHVFRNAVTAEDVVDLYKQNRETKA